MSHIAECNLFRSLQRLHVILILPYHEFEFFVTSDIHTNPHPRRLQ